MYVAVRLGRNDGTNMPNEIAIIGVYDTAGLARKAILQNSTHVFANRCAGGPEGVCRT